MRRGTNKFGWLGLAMAVAIALSCGPTRARGDQMSTQEQTFALTPTDWNPSNTAGNPLTFKSFGALGLPTDVVLDSATLTFNWGFSNAIQLNFADSATEKVTASGGITIGKPGADLTGTNPDPSTFLFPTQTFTNSFSATGQAGQVLYSGGAPNVPTTFTSGQAGYAQPLSVTYSSTSDLQQFLGSGTIGFPVAATAAWDFSSSSGNGTGTSVTDAYPDVVLTYNYHTVATPEPSSILLLGLGAGAWLVWCHRRRRQSS